MPFPQNDSRRSFAAPPLASSLAHSCGFWRSEDRAAARHAIHDRQHAAIHAEPVRDFAIIAHVKHGQVGVFAWFHAAFAVGQAKRPRAVDRRRCDRFRRRHLHMRAGQRHRHRHAERRRRAGIVVRGQRNRDARLNELARVRVTRQAEKVICSGNKRCDRVAGGKGRQVGIVHVVHVVERCGLEAQQRPEPRFAELPHVGAHSQAVLFRGAENLLCFFRAEGSTIAEDVGEPRQLAPRYRGMISRQTRSTSERRDIRAGRCARPGK